MLMKRLIVYVCLSLFCLSVNAEGYQVNLLSAKQTGMGHVGVGMKLGAESIHFNPAGLVFLRSSVDLSLGTAGIMPKATYKFEGYKAETDNPVSTPLYVYAGFKIYDNLAAGISFSTPYGSSLKWPKNWKGASLIQDISLKSFVLQPTLSFKITEGWSIGAGLQMAYGQVDLSRALLSAGEFQTVGDMVEGSALPAEMKDPVLAVIRGNQVPPAYARLKGKAQLKVGFNVGMMLDVCDRLTLGLSYRSKINMKVKEGDAELTYANQTIENLFSQLAAIPGFDGLAIPKYDQGTFRAELPLPANITFGASFRPNDRWELAVDLQHVGWNAYDSLNVYFNEAELGIKPIKAEKNYKNTMIYRLGASYKATERLDLRAGVYYDTTPIRKEHYNPETPGMDKLGLSAGLSFEPYKNLQIDFSFLYICGFGQDGSYTSKNVVTQQAEVFKGKYTSTAFAPSLGVAYCF